jgi:hypothetical protein
MKDEQRATLQVVWEQLNGTMHDLNQIKQAAEDTMATVDDCIARLEQLGTGLDTSDDTYDEYGVNTKNSFNTPPADDSRWKVTKDHMVAWLGSDATKDTLIELLLELANREYDAETMRADIGLYSLHEGK